MASPRHPGTENRAIHASMAWATARRAQTLAFPSLRSCRAASAAASSRSIRAIGVIRRNLSDVQGTQLFIVINYR